MRDDDDATTSLYKRRCSLSFICYQKFPIILTNNTSCLLDRMKARSRMTRRIPQRTKLLVATVWCAVVLCSFLGRVAIVADATSNHGSPSGNKNYSSLQQQKSQQQQHQQQPPDSAVIQVVESELWDASQNAWMGHQQQGYHHRWTNEKGQASLSPSEIQPPDGWDFLGDWKIVINNQVHGGGGCGDAMGWEYQFRYLRPPQRRRVWLRSLQRKKRRELPSSPTAVKFFSSSSPSLSSRRTILQRICDDWNFKGYGMSVYKSFIFPSSCGIGVWLPLTVNFEYFDSRPELPSVTCGTAFYYPWTIVGFLSASIHLEWVKWVFQSTLALIPRVILWLLYKFVLPLMRAVATAVLFPIRHRFPSIPTTIPTGFWTIAKPRYNTEISERVGCSVSCRWSQRSGYEVRISYSHSYLPTFSVYQRLMTQTKQQLDTVKKTVTRRKRSIEESLTANAKSSNNAISINTNDWWQKHFARLGVSTGYPIPSPPHFSCSAILSLSGLYFGGKHQPTISATLSTDDQGVLKMATPALVEKKRRYEESSTYVSDTSRKTDNAIPTKRLANDSY